MGAEPQSSLLSLLVSLCAGFLVQNHCFDLKTWKLSCRYKVKNSCGNMDYLIHPLFESYQINALRKMGQQESLTN